MEFLCTTVSANPRRQSSSLYATSSSSINLQAHYLLSIIFFVSSWQEFFLCGDKRPTAAQCGHKFPVMPPPAVVPLLEFEVPFFFRALVCCYRPLISFACAATVFTDTANLVDNFASGLPFASAWVVAASMLLRCPSRKSRIWFDSGVATEDVTSCQCRWLCAAPGTAPPNGFSLPSLASSACCFATYTFLTIFFHTVHIYWLSGSFDHSLIYFCTPLIWGDTLVPHRACTSLVLGVLHAWNFSALLPSHWWIVGFCRH